jgi:hypothetical protein
MTSLVVDAEPRGALELAVAQVGRAEVSVLGWPARRRRSTSPPGLIQEWVGELKSHPVGNRVLPGGVFRER